MTPAEYLTQVNERLQMRGERRDVHSSELPKVVAGYSMSVGPDDCACQLIADREDALDG